MKKKLERSASSGRSQNPVTLVTCGVEVQGSERCKFIEACNIEMLHHRIVFVRV